MELKVGPGEPVAGPWRSERLDVFVGKLIAGTPRVIAVDGRGGSGKTTLAAQLAEAIGDTAVVHTDDIAWWHSRFGWVDLMVGGVLKPFLAGRGVHYQPPAWAPRGRSGYVDVPVEATTLIVEGVGASRRELGEWIDVAVWVQSDFALARERGIARDKIQLGFDDEEAIRNWDDWQDEEIPFMVADRPWERADFVAAQGGEGEVRTAPPFRS